MNPLLILPAFLAVAVISTVVWFVRARARHRSFYAGRRDALAGRASRRRADGDSAYLDGAVTQMLIDSRERRHR